MRTWESKYIRINKIINVIWRVNILVKNSFPLRHKYYFFPIISSQKKRRNMASIGTGRQKSDTFVLIMHLIIQIWPWNKRGGGRSCKTRESVRFFVFLFRWIYPRFFKKRIPFRLRPKYLPFLYHQHHHHLIYTYFNWFYDLVIHHHQ